MNTLRISLFVAAALALSGCAGFSPDAGVGLTQNIARDELGKDVIKITSDDNALGVDFRVADLLRRPLSPDSAVQIAILRNRGLQAAFNDLGVSEATYVQATLPPTPRISLTRLIGNGGLEIERQIVASLLELATLPARKAVAESRFKAAQYRAADTMLRLAAESRRQYYRTVAANQSVGALQGALGTAEAASALVTNLGETGAISKLEQAREHAFYNELGAQLAKARIQQRVEKEKLIRLLGLWGKDIEFRLPGGLPTLPTRLDEGKAIEARALTKRVDLQMARADLEAQAGQYGLTEATRFISAFSVGLSTRNEWQRTTDIGESGLPTQRNEKISRLGPTVEFSIPIYDFGATGVRGAQESYLASANRLAERAVNVRSEVREAYLRYRGQYDLTRHYQRSVLPLRKIIQDETQLRYNGMLVDVTTLIVDARARILSNIQAVEAQRDFWIAATDLKAAIIGGMSSGSPESGGGSASTVAEKTE